MSMSGPRVAILGGGIAGLSAAWECHRRGTPAVVLETTNRPGGVIRTDRVGPFVLDAGPDAFLVSKPGAITLCRELGISDTLITMKRPRGAYVLRDGTLHALPEGGAFGIPTRLRPFLRSTLISPLGKARVALEPLVPARRAHAGEDESAGTFFRRRFGDEAARAIAQPLLGGIHAGDLDRLSAEAVLPQLVATERSGRSVLLALRAQARRATAEGAFRSFPGGMATLVDALVARLPSRTVRCTAGATTVTRTPDGWVIGTTDGQALSADVLLLAVPAGVAATWLGPLDPASAELAARITYVSSAGVLAVYRDAQIARPLRGSGYVTAPGPEREPLLATSWLTGKWEGRAPDGYTILRGFFGGALDEGTLSLGDSSLADLAHRSWTGRFGISGSPELARIVRWVRASPQHEVGHARRVSTIDGRLREIGNVAVAGSGFRAVGIPDVIADARAAMGQLLDRWHAR